MQPSNMLYFYKLAVHGERKSDKGGLTRIFSHTLCTGNSVSYSAKHINKIFEEGHDTDNLQARLIGMMLYLQEGYHSGVYEGTAGDYEGATIEYPLQYESLRDNLSSTALEAIAAHSPEGAEFFRILIEDRCAFMVETHGQPGNSGAALSADVA